MSRPLVAVMLLLGFLAACSSAEKVVPDPTGITFEAAMMQVVTGLRAAEAEAKRTGTNSLGLDNCTVTVTFNITAGGTDKRSVVLDASIRPPAQVIDAGASAKVSDESTLTAARGNQIAVLLTTAACNPAGTLGTVSPANVKSVADQGADIRGGRRTTYGTTVRE